MHPLVRLYKYSHKYRLDVVLATIYSLLNKLFDVMPEVLIGVAVDVVVKQHNSLIAKYFGITNVITQIVILGSITGLIWVLESTFQYLYTLKWSFLAQNIQHDIRLESYNHIQKLQLEYFEDKQTGNMMSIINDDVNQLERFLNDGLNQIIQIAESTIIIGIIFFFISVKIAALSFIPIPLILIGSFYFRKKLAPLYLNVRNKAGIVNSKLSNNLAGIATIKSFVAENHEIKNLENASNEYLAANKQAIVLSAAITPIIRMAVMIGFLVALIYGGILTIQGSVGVASYSVLIFLSQRLLWPLTYLAGVIDTYQRSMASIKRVMGLLDAKITITDGNKKLPIKTPGEIKFDNISFGYPGRRELFKNLNFTIKPGQTIAFVGSTGSGKSTIIKLLLRFYALNSGRILIDNYDINQLTLSSLREHIGLVSQDTFLIDGDIIDNIKYGTFNATIDEVIAAAKISDADRFIRKLPQGYNTKIGERGQKLSGGQRQRIALSRAIIKNPDILILDEATSALDNQTEAVVQLALERIARSRTTIVIAHRLSTITNADIIHVLQHGKIVESGTHSELISRSSIYANLWNLQLRDI